MDTVVGLTLVILKALSTISTVIESTAARIIASIRILFLMSTEGSVTPTSKIPAAREKSLHLFCSNPKAFFNIAALSVL